MRYLICGVAALALAACEPSVPNSAAGIDPGRGVGFGDYDAYEAEREARLNGRVPAATVTAPPRVESANLDATAESDAAIRAAAANSGVTPVEAAPGNPAPQVVGTPAPQIVSNSAGISTENDFSAVSAQRDIEDDARLLAQNRAQYQVVAPEALPTRDGSDQPNIVAYALRTTNPVGAPLYRRSSFGSEGRYQRACAAYASPDLAQEDFLASGGPERDRKGLDPDGDGFACSWDPTPFRAVRGG